MVGRSLSDKSIMRWAPWAVSIWNGDSKPIDVIVDLVGSQYRFPPSRSPRDTGTSPTHQSLRPPTARQTRDAVRAGQSGRWTIAGQGTRVPASPVPHWGWASHRHTRADTARRDSVAIATAATVPSAHRGVTPRSGSRGAATDQVRHARFLTNPLRAPPVYSEASFLIIVDERSFVALYACRCRHRRPL